MELGGVWGRRRGGGVRVWNSPEKIESSDMHQGQDWAKAWTTNSEYDFHKATDGSLSLSEPLGHSQGVQMGSPSCFFLHSEAV